MLRDLFTAIVEGFVQLVHDDAVDKDEGGHHVQGLVVQQPQHNVPEHLLDLLNVHECPKLGSLVSERIDQTEQLTIRHKLGH